MVTFSRLYVRTERSVPSLKELANSFFKAGDQASKELFDGQEFGVIVRVYEGSLEIVTIITVVVAAIFKAIRDYPSFRNGLVSLHNDARDAGRSIQEGIIKSGSLKKDEIQVSRLTTGHVTQLNRLQRRVREGEISAEEAHDEEMEMLERAGEKVSGKLSKEILDNFKAIKVQEGRVKRKPRPAGVYKSGRRHVYRRGVELERKPGSKKITVRYF